MLAHHSVPLYFTTITNSDSYARFYGSPEGKNLDTAVMKRKKNP